MSIYVCSDIHGQYGLYKKMMEGILFSDDDQLFILGDLIDRGPESIELLFGVSQRDNVTCLLGNHELMMWEFVRKDPQFCDSWIMSGNGGMETLRQFRLLSEEQKNEVMDFIEDMYLQYELKMKNHTYLLSHSFFAEGKGSLKWQDEDDDVVFETVWNSPWRYWENVSKDAYQDGRVHVLGHVNADTVRRMEGKEDGFGILRAYIEQDGSIIDIDCGCAQITDSWIWNCGLCCLNLTAYDAGDAENAFQYFLPEPEDFTISKASA